MMKRQQWNEFLEYSVPFNQLLNVWALLQNHTSIKGNFMNPVLVGILQLASRDP